MPRVRSREPGFWSGIWWGSGMRPEPGKDSATSQDLGWGWPFAHIWGRSPSYAARCLSPHPTL